MRTFRWMAVFLGVLLPGSFWPLPAQVSDSSRKVLNRSVREMAEIQRSKVMLEFLATGSGRLWQERFLNSYPEFSESERSNFRKNLQPPALEIIRQELADDTGAQIKVLMEFVRSLPPAEAEGARMEIARRAENSLRQRSPFGGYYLEILRGLQDHVEFSNLHEGPEARNPLPENGSALLIKEILARFPEAAAADVSEKVQTLISRGQAAVPQDLLVRLLEDSDGRLPLFLTSKKGFSETLPPARSPWGPFLWGVSTSGRQYEGNDTNSQWIPFEAAKRVKESCGSAADGLNRFKEDIGLAKGMNLNAFRTSIEWSRIEPEPDRIDQKAVDFYHSFFREMRAQGLTPVVTLMHFSYPQWLETRFGGWENSESLARFDRYVDFVSREFAEEIDWWLTFNEPETFLPGAYGNGALAPGKTGPLHFVSALRNFVDAHCRAYQIIHRNDSKAYVSFNHYAAYFDFPFLRPSEKELNAPPARGPFLSPLRSFYAWLAKYRDYCALDYYCRIDRQFSMNAWEWKIYAEGFQKILRSYYRAFGQPILIAENGIATKNLRTRPDGWTREAFLVAHVQAMQRAMQEGVPVLGYIHWSITDNWELGTYDSRFGLYSVDCRGRDFTRRPTRSVNVYRQIARQGGVSPDLEKSYPPPMLEVAVKAAQKPSVPASSTRVLGQKAR